MAENIEMPSADLPEDIIFDVLSRLPVKTLIRFKSACKAWHALIGNHNFIKTQQKMQSSKEVNTTLSKLLVVYNGPSNKFQMPSHMPYLSNNNSYVMVGICNGLLCVSLSHESREFIICNPTTRQFRNIPPPFLLNGNCDIVFLGFYLHTNKGYEILRIVLTPQLDDTREAKISAELYNMCTNTWRENEVKLGKSTTLGRFMFMNPHNCAEAVEIDGVFYWKCLTPFGKPDVAYFDMSTHVFDVTKSPWRDPYSYQFNLCHIRKENKLGMSIWRDLKIELWSLKEDMAWVFVYGISCCDIPILEYPFQMRKVVQDTRDGNLVGVTWYNDNLRLLWIDLKTYLLRASVQVEGTIKDVYLFTEALTPVHYDESCELREF